MFVSDKTLFKHVLGDCNKMQNCCNFRDHLFLKTEVKVNLTKKQGSRGPHRSPQKQSNTIAENYDNYITSMEREMLSHL